MNLKIEYTSYYERQLGKLFKKYNEDELESKVNHILKAISTQEFDKDMHPHKIYWHRRQKYVIDCHIEGNLIVLYSLKGSIAVIEAIGTHGDLGIKESFNSDDIVDKHLLELMESVV